MNLKKILLSAAGIILVSAVTIFFMIIFPFIGTKKIQDKGVFAGGNIINVVDGMSQVFIIDGGNSEIGLVDAGNSPDGKPVIEALRSKGFKSSDVKAIFLTHGHSDHIASAKIFPRAKIYSLKEEVEIAEGLKNNPSPVGRIFSPKPTGLKVTNILKDGEKVNLGSLTVEAFSIPGHTEGSAAYLINGVLFLGDAALSSSDGKIRHAVWAFSSDVNQQNRSLKSLSERLTPRKIGIKTILFSHSGYLEGMQPLIDFVSQSNIK
ncbi:MAG TPA: MBL fold metallo-hydrolase [Spirochaetota bacterium]|nr:MBL fold metallo-hydrolase [Spirochaetota bacterium]HPS85555.1 MBL fold metallo-hydrolase [Spirochaetota bacterium]